MDPTPPSQPPAGSKRLMLVLFIIVSIVAASGYFMGLKQTREITGERSPSPWQDNLAYQSDGGIIPQAPAYSEEATANWQANDDWQSHFAQLRFDTSLRAPTSKPREDELAAALIARNARRAYDTAPPVVPHAIDEHNPNACVVCHTPGNSRLIGNRLTPEMSHPYLTNCTQCHVPAAGQHELPELPMATGALMASGNTFQGLPSGAVAEVAYQGAPPVLPHPVWMRQNCMACHGEGRPSAIRTSHPHRQNCLQCHAQNHLFDNRERMVNELPMVVDLLLKNPPEPAEETPPASQ
ncbi:nitrate reductase cytochrome c-type subunit [Sulfuriroseicoccus oceanibius]|uniref:Diheme cytochrome c NapB n=1 Tax=Sulfuriroseicoccus oceanibius TaxID=2707525 RepID=A0A6B3LBF8_9BACT|nr:nitrate reductase cytochrome c-type subunit [Sulfuriroseicoccus oceanibius]QQL44857.1 hypothetical protein G3M56_013420 [Sulfuriroseicoccus oceanibius]